MRSTIALMILLLIASVFAGCLGGDDALDADDADTGDAGDAGDDGEGDGADEGPSDETIDYFARIDAFTADTTSGAVPVNVTFSWEVDTNDENATWALDLGEGSEEQDALAEPSGSLVHPYDAAGNFTVVFTVLYGDGESVAATVNLTLEKPRALPDQWVHEYGPSLGCIGDLAVCISAELGPDEDPIDGFWLAIDERYWGLDFTVRVDTVLEDSDCTAYDDDLEALDANLNGGAGPCEGPIPEGAYWLFMYSYAEPSPSLELEIFPPE